MRSEPSQAALNNKGHVEPQQYKFDCGEVSGKDRTVKHNIKKSEEEKIIQIKLKPLTLK